MKYDYSSWNMEAHLLTCCKGCRMNVMHSHHFENARMNDMCLQNFQDVVLSVFLETALKYKQNVGFHLSILLSIGLQTLMLFLCSINDINKSMFPIWNVYFCITNIPANKQPQNYRGWGRGGSNAPLHNTTLIIIKPLMSFESLNTSPYVHHCLSAPYGA